MYAQRRRRLGLQALCVAFLLVCVAASLLDGLTQNVVAFERDTTVFYYPLATWARSLLVQGMFPAWAPEVFAGYPIFADGELGLGNPFVLLTFLTLPADRALIALRLLYLAIAATGGYALARAWKLPPTAAAMAGLVFSLGSFFQAQIHHENIVRTAAWLPWVLCAAEHALRRRGNSRLRWTLGAAGAIGFAAVGLHVQILAMDILTLVAYAALRWWHGPIAGAAGAVRRAGVLARVCVPAVFLGLLLGAVQLLPLTELATFSVRGGGISYAASAAYSLTPFSLVELLFPFFFRDGDHREWGLWTHWEAYLYVGVTPLVLAAIALGRPFRKVGHRPPRHAAVRFWGLLSAAGLILSMGQYVWPNVYYGLWLVPGLAGLRAPGRFTLLVVLGLAMLAGFGLARCQRELPFTSPGGRSRRGGAALAAAVLGPACAVALVRVTVLTQPELTRSALEAVYLSLPHDSYAITSSTAYAGLLWSTDVLANGYLQRGLLLLAGTLLAIAGWRYGRRSLGQRRSVPWGMASPGWSALLLALTALDLLTFGAAIHPRESLSRLGRQVPAAEATRELLQGDADGPWRVLASPAINEIAPNRLAPLGLQEIRGYSSLESRWHRDLLQRVLSVDDDLLDVWNVRYVLEPSRYGLMASYGGVDFLPDNPLLRGPAENVVGNETFRVPQDFSLAEIRIVSALVNAVETPQDAEVAEVVLRSEDGNILWTRRLLAGHDTMEWAADHPAIASKLQHRRVEVAGLAFERDAEGRAEQRVLSFTALTLDTPLGASTVQIRTLLPHGEFVAVGAALVDPGGATRQLVGRSKTKYRQVYRDDAITVLKNDAAYPRAYVVSNARVAPSPGASLEEIAHGPFDPSREVVLSSDTQWQPRCHEVPETAATKCQTSLDTPDDFSLIPPSDDQPGPAGTAQITAYEPTRVDIEVDAQRDGYLVVSDTYYPGWVARVDGVEQRILRGHLLFRVVPITSGHHRVEMVFQPLSLAVGLPTSLAGTVAIGALALLGPRLLRSRRRAA